jgi:sec-independent protein translocase protein TatA
MDFFGMGLGEVLVILVIALIIFGPGRLLEISRSLGKTVTNIRKTTSEVTSQITREIEEQKKPSSDDSQTKQAVKGYGSTK